MIRKQPIARVAAIGGLTATIALLTDLSAASADELADLRANQELLQRRIDQLAQAAGGRPGVPGGYGTEAVPGQALIGGSFPRSFLIPGTETSIRVGGFVDETLDYWIVNGTSAINGNQTTTVGINGNLTTQSLDQHLQFIPGLTPNTVLSPTVPVPNNAVLAIPGKPGFGALAANIAHSRGHGIFSQSPR